MKAAAPGEYALADVLRRKTTLYLTSAAGAIGFYGKKLLIRQKDGSETGLDLDAIRRVVLCGKPVVGSAILYRLLRLKIAVDWLDILGRPLGQLLPHMGMRRFASGLQAAFAGTAAALELARALILAKTDNCHYVTRRIIADWTGWQELRSAIADAASAASLRGCEGVAAHFYFSRWQGILHKFEWQGRHAHPPPDPVNLLLSLGYTLLYNRLASALHNAGLDPGLGFFHVGRGMHSALASDLMEPLRALVDARVLRLIRRQEIAPEDFRQCEGRCVCTDRAVYAKLLSEFEAMFEQRHKFYPDPANNSLAMRRTFNDMLDDLAESYAMHLHDEHGCMIPRLAPCLPV